MARYNPYNRLLIIPFHERMAAKARLDRGQPLFGGTGLVRGYEDTQGWQEVIIPNLPDTVDKAFQVFGLDRNTATKADIEKATRKLALVHHPDRGGEISEFHKVMEAKETCLKYLATRECGIV